MKVRWEHDKVEFTRPTIMKLFYNNKYVFSDIHNWIQWIQCIMHIY